LHQVLIFDNLSDMPLPLIPGTLLPGETNYPNDLQSLLQRFAANLFTPDPPKEFFRHTSPDQVPSDSLWSDTRNGTLKFQNSASQWKNAISGNFSFGVEADNATVQPNTGLFNSLQTPTSTSGNEISVLKAKPYSVLNRFLVLAHIPGVSANENNVNVYATLVCGSIVFGLTCANTGLNKLQSLFLVGAHTLSTSDIDAQGDVTFRLRLGTDDATAQLYYNRKSPTDTFNNFMKITMVAIEVPVL
jgi:hypothetical protein